jgi:FkbM family methyltransferase
MAYSQHGEDLFIESKLSNIQYGSILDVGANDGITYSNSRLFIEKHNWSAVLVEPTSKCIESLTKLYSNHDNIIIYPYGIDNIEQETEIYLGNLEPGTINQVSTMLEQERQYWERMRSVQYDTEIIKTKTVSQLVADANIDHYNIISIDTEGKDILILKQLYQLGFRPEYYIIEHNSVPETIATIHEICLSEYNLVWQNTINFILEKR